MTCDLIINKYFIMQESITKFDKLVKPNPNIKSRVKY